MKDRESIKDYTSWVSGFVNQMKTYGDNISDQRVVEKYLISLTDKYDSIVGIIEESKDISKLSVTELVGSLQAHEQRISQRMEHTVEGALKSQHKNWPPSKGRKFVKGKGISNSLKEGEAKAKYPPCSI